MIQTNRKQNSSSRRFQAISKIKFVWLRKLRQVIQCKQMKLVSQAGSTTCQFHKWNCQVFINIKKYRIMWSPPNFEVNNRKVFSTDLKVKSPCLVKKSREKNNESIRETQNMLSIFVIWKFNTIFSFVLIPFGDIQKWLHRKNSIFWTPIFWTRLSSLLPLQKW